MPPVDGSIYAQFKPLDLGDAWKSGQEIAENRMKLSDMARARQKQEDLQAALKGVVGADGKVNTAGLSALAAVDPEKAIALRQSADASDIAERNNTFENFQRRSSLVGPHLETLSTLSPEDRVSAWPTVRNEVLKSGVFKPEDLPEQFNEDSFQHDLGAYHQTKDYLSSLESKAKTKNLGSDTTKNYAQAEKDRAEADKYKKEAGLRNPSIIGVTDPAKLVPGLVPKEHQAKAFGEIDAAENTRKMADEIIKSFDEAAQENTILKTGAGLIRTPASVYALHQAMQPTFKDLEGTVRQAAMDNTFKNITPAPGDSDATIARKKEALLGYLQSKASAPVARGFGIDLDKFPSTATYKDTKTGATGGWGDRDSNSAYASDTPPAPQSFAPPPAGTIHMQFPDGKVKVVPASEKGKWIQAGGSVVNASR